MGRRFTIAQLLAVIAVSGVAFAALRSPSYLWANTLYTAAFVALVIAMINVVSSHSRSRAYWAGFLIGGGVYFIVYSVPALREPICPRLLTEPLLDLIYPYVSPPLAKPTVPFRQVCHSLLILFGAIGGGIFARRRFERIALARDIQVGSGVAPLTGSRTADRGTPDPKSEA